MATITKYQIRAAKHTNYMIEDCKSQAEIDSGYGRSIKEVGRHDFRVILVDGKMNFKIDTSSGLTREIFERYMAEEIEIVTRHQVALALHN